MCIYIYTQLYTYMYIHIYTVYILPDSPGPSLKARTLLRLQCPEAAERCTERPGGGGEDRPIHRASLDIDET